MTDTGRAEEEVQAEITTEPWGEPLPAGSETLAEGDSASFSFSEKTGPGYSWFDSIGVPWGQDKYRRR